MKIKELLVEFARARDDDEDTGRWKKLNFKGESVYYMISPVSMERRGYGLQVQLAARARAYNVESEFLHDKSIDAYGKTSDALDAAALKLVFDWLNKHGTDKLHAAIQKWGEYEAEFNRGREVKVQKGRKLPKGYKIVEGPKKGHRFVQTPDGKLVPNQGTNDRLDDQDIIDDFYVWYERNR